MVKMKSPLAGWLGVWRGRRKGLRRIAVGLKLYVTCQFPQSHIRIRKVLHSDGSWHVWRQ